MKAAPFLQSIKGRAKKNSSVNSCAELRIRFLELQRLRQMVRIAECGRIAAWGMEHVFIHEFMFSFTNLRE